MIAEKAADMIKGRQLEPYEPDHGESGDSRYRSHRAQQPLRGAYSRSVPIAVSAPVSGPANNYTRAAAAASYLNSQHLDLNHNHHHHQFMQNKYGSSIMAENIIKKMV